MLNLHSVRTAPPRGSHGACPCSVVPLDSTRASTWCERARVNTQDRTCSRRRAGLAQGAGRLLPTPPPPPEKKKKEKKIKSTNGRSSRSKSKCGHKCSFRPRPQPRPCPRGQKWTHRAASIRPASRRCTCRMVRNLRFWSQGCSSATTRGAPLSPTAVTQAVIWTRRLGKAAACPPGAIALFPAAVHGCTCRFVLQVVGYLGRQLGRGRSDGRVALPCFQREW